METSFGESLSQFVAWYVAEFRITSSPASWFEEICGFAGKYITRWTAGGLLPSDHNWDQFRRKLREHNPSHVELQERLEELTSLLNSTRQSDAERRRSTRSKPKTTTSGVLDYFEDIVDIVDLWQELFLESRRLDLLVMYASTWRNTHLKHLREMLCRSGSRLRVVLPREHPELLRLYAARLGVSPNALRSRINDAVTEFQNLAKYGRVEIYRTSCYMNHALYLFELRGVFAFYSFRTDRSPTPALLIGEGSLLEFAREDFAWLVSKKNKATQLVFASRKRKV